MNGPLAMTVPQTLVFFMCRPYLVLILAVSCSDYGLNKRSETAPSYDTGIDETVGDDTAIVEDTGDDAVDGTPCPSPDTGVGAVAIDESCTIERDTGWIDTEIEWVNTEIGLALGTPVVGMLTDDNLDGVINDEDLPDIVVIGELGVVYALHGDGSGIIWSTTVVPPWDTVIELPGGGEILKPALHVGTAAIGDLDGDDRPDVVVSGDGGFYALRGETGVVMWSNPGSRLGLYAGGGGPGIYDLDGDGLVEVVHATTILNGQNGLIRGDGEYGVGLDYPDWPVTRFGVAADINQDGLLEVVAGNALYDAWGHTLWYNGESEGLVAVGNFDDDPFGEIVVSKHGWVRLQDDDGTVLWSNHYGSDNSGPPVIADFDADGRPEIGIAGHEQYLMLDSDGSVIWSRPIQDTTTGYMGSSAFDFDGDGYIEVVYADEHDVWIFDGLSGVVRQKETRHVTGSSFEYPAVADVDGDGEAEIIYTNSNDFIDGDEIGLTVLGSGPDRTWMPARPVWNQHAYSSTNVRDDGSIPEVPLTNWLHGNNFRSADLNGASVGVMADAIPELVEICTEECDEGRLRLVFRVANGGVRPLPSGVSATLYADVDGDWQLIETRTTNTPIGPGETTPGWVYDIDPADVLSGRLRFVVDDDGTQGWLNECHEDNNTIMITDGLCPPVDPSGAGSHGD
jgi:hypothetical protein